MKLSWEIDGSLYRARVRRETERKIKDNLSPMFGGLELGIGVSPQRVRDCDQYEEGFGFLENVRIPSGEEFEVLIEKLHRDYGALDFKDFDPKKPFCVYGEKAVSHPEKNFKLIQPAFDYNIMRKPISDGFALYVRIRLPNERQGFL